MKKLFLTLLVALLAIAGAEARIYVLATGISNYGDERNNLSQTTKDVKRFKKVMETQTKDITVLTSKNVTHDNVLEKLRAICNRAQKDDQVVFYYSGHGIPGAICGYDRPIPYDEIVDILSRSEAGSKIVYVDACRAGTIAEGMKGGDNSWTEEVKGNKDQIFFVSSRANENSAENSAIGASLFTQSLIKGLKGKCDTNGDKQITVIELFKYIHGDVMKHSKDMQHPQLIGPQSMYDVVLTKW